VQMGCPLWKPIIIPRCGRISATKGHPIATKKTPTEVSVCAIERRI
jgi:hypothetical protein